MGASDFNLWLEGSVTEVLESMCFLFPEVISEPEAVSTIQHGWLSSRLCFSGVPSGTFWLCASPPSARAIAANFLGEEMTDISDAQAAEVVGEMANMICGSMLGRYEPRRSFDLTSPTMGIVVSPEGAASSYFARVFAFDQGVLHAGLDIGMTS